MTKTELGNIPDFQKLKDDPRFKALVDYLRGTPTAARSGGTADMSHKAGEFQGWFDCIAQIEGAFTETPTAKTNTEKRVPYANV